MIFMHWAYWPALKKGDMELKVVFISIMQTLGKYAPLSPLKERYLNQKFESVVCENKDISP